MPKKSAVKAAPKSKKPAKGETISDSVTVELPPPGDGPLWTVDTSSGSPFERVAEETTKNLQDLGRQVIGSHAYYVWQFPNGDRVLRPASYVGDDRIVKAGVDIS